MTGLRGKIKKSMLNNNLNSNSLGEGGGVEIYRKFLSSDIDYTFVIDRAKCVVVYG